MDLMERYLADHFMSFRKSTCMTSTGYKYNVTKMKFTFSDNPEEKKREPNLLLTYIQLQEKRQINEKAIKSSLLLFA